MKHRNATSALALALLAASSTGAWAEITADQAWEAIKSYSEGFGQTITGTASKSGDTLTVSGVTVAMDLPEGKMEGALGDITFTELGNGAVEVTIPPEYPMTFSVDPAEGEAVAMVVNVRQSGLKTVVSGDPGNTTYDFSADEIAIDIPEITADGETLEMNLIMALNGLAGKYVLVGTGARDVTASLTANSGAFSMDVKDPEGQGNAKVKADFADIASSSSSTIPASTDMADMSAMLRSGFATDGRLTYGKLDLDFEFEDAEQTMTMVGGADGGSLDIAMNSEALAYGGNQTGLTFTVSGSEIPLPEVTAQIAETAFRIAMPLAQSEEPGDFTLLASYKGIAVSDMIWGMFDPGAVLPRDPANLVIDVAGKARWLVDIMDPAAAESMGDRPPAEVEALDINALELTIAGASLTGDGAFAFDTTDLTTFPGMPAPSGTANLQLVGGNTLMDKLIQMGLLPEEQAMGFRMMLGLFARPGEGEDTLVSEISVTEDGQVLANGQRLK